MTASAFRTSIRAPLGETAEARAARIEWERIALAEADAQIDAGLGISGDELEAFLQAFVSGEPLPGFDPE